MKLEESAKRKKQKKPSPTEVEAPELEVVHDSGEPIGDPTATTSRGRPTDKRKKSGLHLKASKPVKCSVCSSNQHTAPNCPSKITPDPMEQDLLRNMV